MLRSGLVLLVLAGAALAGCTSDRVDGCTPPPNETALLDEYLKEPALGVRPGEGSKRRKDPERQVACRKVGKAVSTTSVFVQWDLSRDLSPDEVQGLYGPATTGAGWTVVPARSGSRYVQFCKNVLGERSILDVTWQDAVVLERGERVPGVVTVGVRVAGVAEPSCP